MKRLEEVTPKEEFLTVFEATVLDYWKEKGQSFGLEAKRYEKQLVALEKKRKKIFEMREDGSYTKGEFQERSAQVENEVIATKISLSEARIE